MGCNTPKSTSVDVTNAGCYNAPMSQEQIPYEAPSEKVFKTGSPKAQREPLPVTNLLICIGYLLFCALLITLVVWAFLSDPYPFGYLY